MSEQSVVVLKDEGNVALHLMQQLSKLGYNVIATAASGENALAQVRTLHPDVVLKDIHTEGPIEGLETAMQIALDAVRIHGGYGYSTEFDVERYFRDAPLMIVGEGTNEIQRNVIASQLVKRGGLERW